MGKPASACLRCNFKLAAYLINDNSLCRWCVEREDLIKQLNEEREERRRLEEKVNSLLARLDSEGIIPSMGNRMCKIIQRLC